MTRLALAAPRLLMPGGAWTGPAALTIADGRIEQLHETPPPGAEQMPSGALTPGLLDIHNNGAFGVDFATADPAAWRRVLTELARRGVTAVQPTVITAPIPDLLDAMDRIDAAMAGTQGARILGAHLEGPFLAPERRGAHRADWIQQPTEAALDTLLNHPATRRVLRTVTLAPERPGGTAAVRRLAEAGIVVSVGHSDATAAETIAAADAGATMVTHLFNAMSPLSHRAPGVPGAALTDERIWCCLIVDGAHVDPIACRLVFQAAPGRVIAVSDSIIAAGLPPGTTSEFGGLPIVVDATGLCRRPDGTISGAGIVLDQGVRRMIAIRHRPGRRATRRHRSARDGARARRSRPAAARCARGSGLVGRRLDAAPGLDRRPGNLPCVACWRSISARPAAAPASGSATAPPRQRARAHRVSPHRKASPKRWGRSCRWHCRCSARPG